MILNAISGIALLHDIMALIVKLWVLISGISKASKKIIDITIINEEGTLFKV